MSFRPWFVSFAFAFSCGGGAVIEVPQDGDLNNGDAAVSQTESEEESAEDLCGDTQCSNCIDDDNDGQIDGFDAECVSAADDREDSFATGIPGDNKDAIMQDCFFDGDSGHGNDGCQLHICCLLEGDCPADLSPEKFDPNNCEVSDQCVQNCQPITPPGCDCFGCCTVCSGQDCRDVILHPDVSVGCEAENLDSDSCVACTKQIQCGTSECAEDDCTLCPGQTADDLPEQCGGSHSCNDSRAACERSADCADGDYCLSGCCTATVQ